MTPRSTPLLDWLTEDQARLLLHAKVGGDVADKRHAEGLLRRLVDQGRSVVPGPKRPGPRKKETTNRVDDEIRRLVSAVRAQLGLDYGISKARTLLALDLTISEVHRVLADDLLLSQPELSALQTTWICLADYLPASKDLIDALGEIVERFSEGALREAGTLECIVQGFLQAHSGADKDEEQIYTSLAQALCLIEEPTAEARKEKKHQGKLNEAYTYKDAKLRRQDILSTAIARLTHLKGLFAGNHMAVPGQLFLNLFDCVRQGGRDHPEAMELYQNVLRVLCDAMKHQGFLHPRHASGVCGPAPKPKVYSEGEVFAGWPRHRETFFYQNFRG